MAWEPLPEREAGVGPEWRGLESRALSEAPVTHAHGQQVLSSFCRPRSSYRKQNASQMPQSLSSGRRTAGGPEVGTLTLGPPGESLEAAEKSSRNRGYCTGLPTRDQRCVHGDKTRSRNPNSDAEAIERPRKCSGGRGWALSAWLSLIPRILRNPHPSPATGTFAKPVLC